MGRSVADGAATLPDGLTEAACRKSVHVSQQNTFTGRLTPEMLREVLERAKVLAGVG